MIWRCNVCSFSTRSEREARVHANEKDGGRVAHLVFNIVDDVDVSKWSGWASRHHDGRRVRYVMAGSAGRGEDTEEGGELHL